MVTPTMDPELLAATIRKLDAEVHAIEARIAREDAASRAEREKMALDIEHVALSVRLSRVVTDRQEREAKEASCDWRYQHRYVFAESTTAAGVSNCMDRLNVWDQLDPGCDIEVVFNSPGGDVIAGMSLFDYLRNLSRKGHKITTVATGMAASMAGILLQAGDVRVATRESIILIHEIAFSAGGKIGEVEDTWLMAQKLTEHVIKIFVQRSNGKLTEEYLKAHWARKDWWLDAEEALALGIIDEIR